MSYSINPSVLGSMFALPTQVVDNYIKLAGPAQIKTLLWIFRNASNGVDIAKISEDTGYSQADVKDALMFWCEVGIIVGDESVKVNTMPAPEIKKENQSNTKAELPEIQPIRPSYEQIQMRCKESPQISNMFSDIQKMLGKTIGYDSQSVLIMMHDQYGLPVEVIYMIVSYCVSIDKASFSYISKVGKDWGEKEIDTIEKADEQIKILNKCNGIWKKFAAMAGIQNPRPTASQSAFIKTWSVEMKFNVDMIYLAYEEMVDHSSRISFPYMNKILASWHEKGLKTPMEVERDKADFRKGTEKKKTDKKSSYDMDEFSRRADKLPVYNKKK